MRKVCIAVLLSVSVLSACHKTNNNCDYDACAIKAPATEITQLETYLTNAGITATKHCSGIYYSISNAGAGATASTCSYVSVTYKGSLTNGNVFDQTTAGPVAFPLATLIESWKKGIPLIKKGGVITLYVPPSLGYGNSVQSDRNGNVIIPANSILIFEITLMDVQ